MEAVKGAEEEEVEEEARLYNTSYSITTNPLSLGAFHFRESEAQEEVCTSSASGASGARLPWKGGCGGGVCVGGGGKGGCGGLGGAGG